MNYKVRHIIPNREQDLHQLRISIATILNIQMAGYLSIQADNSMTKDGSEMAFASKLQNTE